MCRELYKLASWALASNSWRAARGGTARSCSAGRARARAARAHVRLRTHGHAMALRLSLALALVAAAKAGSGSAPPPPTTILYVSPTGSATGTGTKDSPLGSCAAAVAKLSTMGKLQPGGVTIQFAPGKYPLTNTTACGTIKSLNASSSPVVFRGAPGGGTEFDASIQLDATLLKPVTDAKILKIINPSAKTKVMHMPMASPPGTLSWDGVPLTGSVWPNKGLGYVKKVLDKGAVWASGRT